MPFRGRRRSRGSRRAPSQKVWGGWVTFDSPTPNIGPGRLDPGEYAANWLLSPNDAADFYDEPTLIRTLSRFRCNVAISTGDIANEYGALVQFGLIIYKGDDNVPPFINTLDVTKDWIYYDSVMLYHHAGAIGQVFAVDAEATPYLGVVDIKSKRKIPEGSGLAAIVFNNNQFPALDTIAIDFYWGGRYLMINH